MFVVGGVLFAIALLSLATILNAAVFTGELATRQNSVGEDRVIGYQHAAVSSVEGSIFHANYNEYESQAQVVAALRGRVGNWSQLAGRIYAGNRVLTSTNRAGLTNGSYLFQANEGPFTAADGDDDWTLVRQATGTRRFSLNVTRDSLASPTSTDTLANLTAPDPFRIRVTNGSATAAVIVYERADEVVVRTVAPEGGLREDACSAAGERVTVEITAGRVGGESCDALGFPLVQGEYEVAYRNGDAAAGQYGLVTDVPAANVDETPYAAGTRGATPHVVPAVYAMTLNITYTADELRYTTTERVTPERPPQHRVYGVASGPRRSVVFVDPADDGLRTIDPATGVVRAYDATGVQAIGPLSADLDGDDRREIPYVTSAGTLKLIDSRNETQVLASSATQSKTLLGVGTWGNATFDRRPAVYYVNTSDGTLDRAWYDAADDTARRQQVRTNDGDGDGIGAVAGIADYNGDGDTDVVFTDGSAHVTYMDGGRTHETDENVGGNNGIGVGEPRDLDADGTVRAPIVDGSNNVALLPDNGVSEDRTSSGPATKSPVAGVEWANGTAGQEVVFIDTSSGTLHYVTAEGDIVEITNAEGAPVAASDDQGVA